MATQFKRITKREAFKRFCAGQYVDFCPVKLRPGFPWAPQCRIWAKEHLERAEHWRGDAQMWKGTLEKTAWDLAYNAWAYYNTSYEAGYYAAYYIEA